MPAYESTYPGRAITGGAPKASRRETLAESSWGPFGKKKMAKDGRKRVTRGRILESALSLFAQRGFKGATTRAIADGANVGKSKPAFRQQGRPVR